MSDENRQKIIMVLLAVILLGVGIWAFGDFLGDQEAVVLLSDESFENLPVTSASEEQIVYTMDLSAERDIFENDCENRGGDFNDCGRACEGEECSLVCAYTCEF
jgi:hypothetical protein